jgi:plastocyanin
MKEHAMRPIRLILVLIVLAWAGAAQAADTTVSIGKTGFSPASVRISAGDTVTFVNADTRDHAVSGGGLSESLKPGQSVPHRFARKGKFAITCQLHPREALTIVVE